MVIYVDIVFLENLILDFIILLATGIICGTHFKIWRLVCSSCFSSISTVISIIFGLNNFFLKFILSFFIVIIAFGFHNKKFFVKQLGVFYLTTITFGGTSFMLLFFCDPQAIVYQAGHFLGTYPVKMAVLRRNIGICINCSSAKNIKEKIFKNM